MDRAVVAVLVLSFFFWNGLLADRRSESPRFVEGDERAE